MDLDFELYDGKKYSDLLKDIVKNHKSKQNQIKLLTDQLVEMVEEPGDATTVSYTHLTLPTIDFV